MSVIDAVAALRQIPSVQPYDEIICELLEAFKKRGAQAKLAKLLDIPPSRLSELKRGGYKIQQRDMHKVLEFLGKAETTPLSPQPWSPKASTVAALLEAVRPSLLATGANGADLGIVAHNIAAALRQIAREPSIEDNEDQLRLVCDFVADRVQLDMSATG